MLSDKKPVQSLASVLHPGPIRSHSSEAVSVKAGCHPQKPRSSRYTLSLPLLKTLPVDALTAQSRAALCPQNTWATARQTWHARAAVQATPLHTRKLRPDGTCSSHIAWERPGGSRGHAAPSAHCFDAPCGHHPARPQSVTSLGQQQPPGPSPAPSTPPALLRTGLTAATASPCFGVQKLVVVKSPAKGVRGLEKHTKVSSRGRQGSLGKWPRGGRCTAVTASSLADVPRLDTETLHHLEQTTYILGTSVSPPVK